MYITKYLDTIKKGEKVVDLASGDKPNPKASVFVDFYEDVNTQRDGASFKKPKKGKYIHWDLNKYPYPFKDKEFDFVIAGHIAEHLEDPLKFCLEIQRIGKRGYIETPAKLYEQIYGWDFHLWYVYLENNKLIFENIKEKSFLGEYVRNLYHVKQDAEFRKLHDENIEKLLTCFYWENLFDFEIRWNSVVSENIGKKSLTAKIKKHLKF